MAGPYALAQGVLSLVKQEHLVVLAITFVVVCVSTRIISASGSNARSKSSTDGSVGGAQIAPAVPYWVPYLGHIPQMVFGPESFLAGLRKLYPRGAFSLNFLGGVHTVIFKPGLIASLINQPVHVADGHAASKHLMKTNFGWPRHKASMETYDKMLHELLALYRILSSEPSLGQMVDRTVQRLRHNIADLVTFNESEVDQTEWEKYACAETIQDKNGQPVVEADLYELVRNFIAMTANVSLFGTDFVENYPRFWQALWRFDDGFMALAADLPFWLPIQKAIAARRARSEAMACLREFHNALEADREGQKPKPEWADIDNVSPLIQSRVDEVYRKYNLSMEQRASSEFGLAWAMNANANPLVFWMLWRINSDAVLLARIRNEIAPYITVEQPALGFGSAFKAAQRIQTIDVDGLVNKCPLLKAAYVETLRLDVSAWSFKVIREDVIISDKDASSDNFLLKKGTYAHGAHELNHTNPDVFEDPKEWSIDRHIKWDASNASGEKLPVGADMGVVRPYGKSSSEQPCHYEPGFTTVPRSANVLRRWGCKYVQRSPVRRQGDFGFHCCYPHCIRHGASWWRALEAAQAKQWCRDEAPSLLDSGMDQSTSNIVRVLRRSLDF
jgi:cytochrome P450